MLRIAINGFGRIGRTFLKQALEREEVKIVAVNDLGELESLAYLLRYDSVYGRYAQPVEGKTEGEKRILKVAQEEIIVLNERQPENLPWDEMRIDVVVESTGVFTRYELAAKHLQAGAKRVVISAPAKGEVQHVLVGTNQEAFTKEDLSKITSDASCTTNAVTPLMAVLAENPGIKKALMTTVHGYTASQNLVDGPNKKSPRRGRAAAQNIVPGHTGAADATVKSLPGLTGLFDAVAIRVPVISGSIVDLTFLSARATSVEEINSILTQASQQERWQKIIKVTDEPIVSSDVLGEPYASIVDLNLTRVVSNDLVKVFAWYDNEWGYCATLLEHVISLKPLLSN